jgi:3'(2'), 5'-bisphosphate nucleotidase
MEKIKIQDEIEIDLSKLIDISKIAGDEIMKIYEGYIQVQEKESESFESGKSPLTNADIKSNEIICNGLKENYPNIPIISEENKEIDYSIRREWKYFWLIDPLDGTKEFIKKNGEFTVNIALIKDGFPIIGVVYAPVKKTIYFGDTLNGSFRIGEDKQKIKLNSVEKKEEGIRIVASKSHFTKETEEFVNNLKKEYGSVDLVNAGSSLKLCLVAEGSADIYPRLGPTMEWDTAAAHAVVKFSGKNVYDFSTNKELRYNKENLLNPYFIVK